METEAFKFVKKHINLFDIGINQRKELFSICELTDCFKCKAQDECILLFSDQPPLLTKEEVEYFKKNYIEHFI